MEIDSNILDWLLEGDPIIRWQVMRDLLQEPQAAWRAEQDRIPHEDGARGFSATSCRMAPGHRAAGLTRLGCFCSCSTAAYPSRMSV
jgi:hypothetical protein